MKKYSKKKSLFDRYVSLISFFVHNAVFWVFISRVAYENNALYLMKQGFIADADKAYLNKLWLEQTQIGKLLFGLPKSIQISLFILSALYLIIIGLRVYYKINYKLSK